MLLARYIPLQAARSNPKPFARDVRVPRPLYHKTSVSPAIGWPFSQHRNHVTQTQLSEASEEPTFPSMLNRPQLTLEQQRVVDLIMSGKNVFYTGSAGSGKSTVLKESIRRLTAADKSVYVVAPTGRAALNVGGMTTWRYLGWSPNSPKYSLSKLKERSCDRMTYRRFTSTDVLVIDEISLVENHFFERWNEVMKHVRTQQCLPGQPPFGGVQLIVTGDFCQLPPVKPFQFCPECGFELTHDDSNDGEIHICSRHGTYYDKDKWAFRSKAWEECKFTHVHLKTVHRQKDPEFVGILNKLRFRELLSSKEVDILINHDCETKHAISLYPTRNEAARVNQTAFTRMEGIKYTYWCRDTFIWHKTLHPHLGYMQMRKVPATQSQGPLVALKEHRFAEYVQLKNGMPVVLLVNLDIEGGLCNGSQGVICGFEPYDPSRPMGGTTNIDRVPEEDRNELYEVDRFINDSGVSQKAWPIVRFHNGEVRTIYADCWCTAQGDEQPWSWLMRTQIPLAPGWAMTIHKSQGLTLDRAIVDLSKAFEPGQVYVGISRVRALSGLKIEGGPKSLLAAVGEDEQVAEFHRENFGDLKDISTAGSFGSED